MHSFPHMRCHISMPKHSVVMARGVPLSAIQSPLAAGLLTLLMGCAGQVTPGGGPIDTSPPLIVRTIPDSNAVHVSDPYIELEFNKYVDRRSVEEALFISPVVGPLEFDWSGTTVGFHIKQPLRKNTTYVVNVGTDVADVRAGNRMAHGYTLAFSSGDSIDYGSVSGRIFDDKPPDGVIVFAYALRGILADTLDPTHTKPDYAMQAGRDGSFLLSHLSLGTYRLVAVRDEYKNLVYDRQIDAYGVWRKDVSLSSEHSSVRGVDVRLGIEDTARPFLTAARALDKSSVLLRVSEPVDTVGFSTARFFLQDTLTGTKPEIYAAVFDLSQRSEITLVLGTGLDSGHVYRAGASGLADRAGNRLDAASAGVFFAGTSHADTSLPRITSAFRDSTREVPVDTPIVVSFSKPVVRESATAVSLLDASHMTLPYRGTWRGGFTYEVIPQGGFRPGAWYTLSVDLGAIKDYNGHRAADTVLNVRFRTTDLRTTGAITGTVVAPDALRTPTCVIASTLDQNPPVRRTMVLPRPGPFALERLPEGRYTIQAFSTSDSSTKYDPGQVLPFRPSAVFGAYPDTLRVRARWEVQGVRIEMR